MFHANEASFEYYISDAVRLRFLGPRSDRVCGDPEGGGCGKVGLTRNSLIPQHKLLPPPPPQLPHITHTPTPSHSPCMINSLARSMQCSQAPQSQGPSSGMGPPSTPYIIFTPLQSQQCSLCSTAWFIALCLQSGEEGPALQPLGERKGSSS